MQPILDGALAPRTLEILLTPCSVALVSTAFPICKLKWSAFLGRSDAAIVVHANPRRQISRQTDVKLSINLGAQNVNERGSIAARLIYLTGFTP